MRRELSANESEALRRQIRPADDVARIRLQIARDQLAGIRSLGRPDQLHRLAVLVAGSGITLTTLYGIGRVTAGRILAETGDVARFASTDHFASYNGAAPIDVSSGDPVRHRLSRTGNRRTCHTLRMMAVTQIRNPGIAGRAYERKRGEGETPKEALVAQGAAVRPGLLSACRRSTGTIKECGSPTIPRRTRPASTSRPASSRRAASPSRPRCRQESAGSVLLTAVSVQDLADAIFFRYLGVLAPQLPHPIGQLSLANM